MAVERDKQGPGCSKECGEDSQVKTGWARAGLGEGCVGRGVDTLGRRGQPAPGPPAC
jgi:hypothetical protein